MSSSLKPRVVTAGVPSLIPLVTNGLLGSFGMVFLLQSYSDLIQHLFNFFTGQILLYQANQHEMIVGSA